MFEFHDNTLCIESSFLMKLLEISIDSYGSLCRRKKIKVLRRGGYGRTALVEFDTMRADLKKQIVDKVGDPHVKFKRTKFTDMLQNDLNAVKFFNNYTTASGEQLPQNRIAEYVANANVLNAINELITKRSGKRTALGGRRNVLWENISKVVEELPRHTYPHSLPANVRRLKDKFRQYREGSYEALVHKGYANNNSEKINDNAKLWIIARYADRVKKVANLAQLLQEYNAKAQEEGWKELKSEQTLYIFLNSEENVALWYGHRYGEKKADEKFMYQHKTALPSMRDSLWYSDGTKLNYFYQDENGKPQTIQVYEVMDAFSEVFLGYHISPTEDYEAQYHAYKMAVKFSGFRPYQIGFDNQGGHKKLESGNFLQKLARITIKAQPYNAKSKSIESAFGRFQQQYLKRDWFFTGQNITAKQLESKANMEFILANAKNLPTLQEVKATYLRRRSEWNNAIHPKTGISRMEMYLNSRNPESSPIEIWDMIDLFWIQRQKPVMCTAAGIEFTEKKQEYSYMVYDEDGLPDFQFLKRSIDKKFIIKFDPEDMSLIQLYEDTPSGIRYVTSATTKVEIHRGKQEQTEGENSFIKRVELAKKEARIQMRDEANEILEGQGMTVEQYGLNEPNIKGIETKRKKSKKQLTQDVGEWMKDESNLVPIIEEKEDQPFRRSDWY